MYNHEVTKGEWRVELSENKMFLVAETYDLTEGNINSWVQDITSLPLDTSIVRCIIIVQRKYFTTTIKDFIQDAVGPLCWSACFFQFEEKKDAMVSGTYQVDDAMTALTKTSLYQGNQRKYFRDVINKYEKFAGKVEELNDIKQSIANEEKIQPEKFYAFLIEEARINLTACFSLGILELCRLPHNPSLINSNGANLVLLMPRQAQDNNAYLCSKSLIVPLTIMAFSRDGGNDYIRRDEFVKSQGTVIVAEKTTNNHLNFPVAVHKILYEIKPHPPIDITDINFHWIPMWQRLERIPLPR